MLHPSYSASNGSNGMLVSRSTRVTKQGQQQHGRRSQTIISSNLKTELCRNFEKGLCTYGDRCAFAHGREELKYRTLREMQNAGRIPDAVKYRCIPCMTWVATGSCPYSTRCVFVHDPRVQGRQEAWLYAGSHMSSAYHSSDSAFFFPDLRRDPDSQLPRDSSLYDLDPAMSIAQALADRAVYSMWYSFISVLTNLEAMKAQDESASSASSARSRLAIQPAAPSPSSTNSTISPTGRGGGGGGCDAFGSNYSMSPRSTCSGYSSSIGGGCGGEDEDYEDCRHLRLTAAGSCHSPVMKRGGSFSSESPIAAKQHRAAERRLAYGGCPRLQCFVGLSRGIPARPPTPTSPDFFVDGFPVDGSSSAFSFPVTPPAADNYSSGYSVGVNGGERLQSSRSCGGWGWPSKQVESPASMPRHKRYPSPASMTPLGMFEKKPHANADVVPAAVYEPSPLKAPRSAFRPIAANENHGRIHCCHLRHISPTVKTTTKSPTLAADALTSTSAFAAKHNEYQPQSPRFHARVFEGRRRPGPLAAIENTGYGTCVF